MGDCLLFGKMTFLTEGFEVRQIVAPLIPAAMVTGQDDTDDLREVTEEGKANVRVE